ncbi:uncharacterized protein [Miscanthus floridulus]|uniref:uncharacterized protein n=1 Tax=Miscanthus floridulus TaxID=154761 RepID=UPI00345A1C14
MEWKALESERKARSEADQEVLTLRGQVMGMEEANAQLREQLASELVARLPKLGGKVESLERGLETAKATIGWNAEALAKSLEEQFRQFGLGQLPPQLFFKDILRPREDISELSTIGSQSVLGAVLLSQAFDLAPTRPSSIDPQEELILVETTDASKMAEDILPEETLTQEQESNSLLIENDPAVTDIQAVDSPIQHTTDDVNVESSKLIQPDITDPEGEKAQRNLSDRETLLAKGNSNRQEAKELTQLIDHLKNSSLSIDPELSQLEVRRAKLEKELENMKAAIEHHKSTLAQIPDAIKQKKHELLAKVRECRAIQSSLKNIPGSIEEDKQQITEVDAIWLEVLKAI